MNFPRLFPSIPKLLILAALLTPASAQNNPVPQIVGPVRPDAVPPGSGAFTLSVYGANFVPGSVVNWNYQPRTTTYISGHEIQAQILSIDVEKNTGGYITVTNPPPGGGSSTASWAQVEVHDPISNITVGAPQYHDFGIWQLAAADFTNDTNLDLVGEVGSAAGFMLGTGKGTFLPKAPVDPHYLNPFQIGYGDFNNDGNLDVVVPSSVDSFEDYPNYLDMRLGDGRGTFSPSSRLELYKQDGAAILVGDFNRDGNLDLITSAGNISLYRGKGDGTFSSPRLTILLAKRELKRKCSPGISTATAYLISCSSATAQVVAAKADSESNSGFLPVPEMADLNHLRRLRSFPARNHAAAEDWATPPA